MAIAFVLGATSHGPMILNRLDYHATEKGAYGVGCQLLQTGFYDWQEGDIIQKLLVLRHEHHGDGVLAIDGGANIGVRTLDMARVMTGWGQVISFEPQEFLFYALCGNIALNNMANAKAVYAALGNQSEPILVPFLDYGKSASYGSLELRPSPNAENIGQPVDYNKGQSVPVVAIDKINLHRLDFLKLDIEGMELEALAGANSTIEKHKPILFIEALKTNAVALSSWLKPMGYISMAVGINLLCIHSDDPVRESITMENPELGA